MKIAIISAMEKERKLILPLIKNAISENLDGLEIFKGEIGQHQIILIKCGIGKVNAAICTYKTIRDFHPDLILNTGVAGGASSHSEIGDILIADYVAYHDVWCGPGTEPGVADGVDVFMECDPSVVKLARDILGNQRYLVGLICSGDRFISEKEEIIEIHKLFPEVLAVDMESAAIAHVCVKEGVKFNIIRIVSDTPGSGKNLEEYKNFWKEAPEKTFALIKEILLELK